MDINTPIALALISNYSNYLNSNQPIRITGIRKTTDSAARIALNFNRIDVAKVNGEMRIDTENRSLQVGENQETKQKVDIWA